jgi:hypothetical protein
MARLDEGEFDRADYYANPSDYHSVFAQKVRALRSVLMLYSDVLDRAIPDWTDKRGRVAVWLPANHDYQGYAGPDRLVRRRAQVGCDTGCIVRLEGMSKDGTA